MRMARVGMWAMAMVLAGGISAAVAHADGVDPQGKFQAPSNGGTPGVSDVFALAPFGSTSNGCTFADGVEDCIFKNQSSFNWTYVTLSTSQDTPCSLLPFTTDLFENVSCSNDPQTGDATFIFSGVHYAPSTASFLNNIANLVPTGCNPPNSPQCDLTDIQTPIIEAPEFSGNCMPDNADGVFPGVPIGCDFEFTFSPGPDDSGDWTQGTTYGVVAPEPSTIGLLLSGLVGLPFIRRRRKSVR